MHLGNVSSVDWSLESCTFPQSRSRWNPIYVANMAFPVSPGKISSNSLVSVFVQIVCRVRYVVSVWHSPTTLWVSQDSIWNAEDVHCVKVFVCRICFPGEEPEY